MYNYKSKVTKVYDGDTITVDIDLGFNTIKKKESIRLFGIDTPELRGSTETEKKLAVRARDYLASLILGEEVTIESQKKGKYGRYLCKIYLQEIDINKSMVEKGYAREYFGGTKQGWL